MGNINFEWAAVTKASLEGVDENGQPKEKLKPGDYDATITDVRAVNTKGGAFGVHISYSVEPVGQTVKEFICLTTKAGQPMIWGPSKLKRRMKTGGLTPEQITNFRYPSKETELADFKLLLDAKVIISVDEEEIKDGLQKGKKFPRVQRVFPRASAKE